MPEKPIELILSKKSESVRFYLLLLCFINFLVVNVGLFPKEINTFSFKIENIDYNIFLVLLLFLITFYTLLFIIFSLLDWLNYKLLNCADTAIWDWEKRKIDLSKDKYEVAINEFKNSLTKGARRMQEQLNRIEYVFIWLPPDHSFLTLKKRIKRYLTFAHFFQFILPYIEIVAPIIIGIYSITIIILELF